MKGQKPDLEGHVKKGTPVLGEGGKGGYDKEEGVIFTIL